MAFATSFRDRLVHDWYEPRPTKLARWLWPLSRVFAVVAALRRIGYRTGLLRSTALPVPVIVVGNIAVGGTGKTPLAIGLAGALRMRGKRPGIVSRGYGGDRSAPRPVEADADPADVGDEPVLLAQAGAPVWVGADRVETALGLLAAHPEVDVIVSDDGLQHYALGRDCEIAVVDGARGFGNGWLLPAGPLREPVERLRRVDAVVVNGPSRPVLAAIAETPVVMMTLEGDRFVNLANGAIATAADFEGLRVHAIAGIGHPDRFFATLRSLGVDPVCHPFPDHHRYTRHDLDFDGAGAIVMTGKDAIKCRAFADARMWSLPVTARFDPALVDRVLDRLVARMTERAANSAMES